MRPASLLVFLAACCLLPAAGAADTRAPGFVVIAHPGTRAHLNLDRLARIYQRKQTNWKDGTRIQPVNLPATHPLRRAFSQAVFGMAPEDMEAYWRERYFHGVLPPHVLASEEAARLFVQSTPGAIAYVSTCVPAQSVDVLLTEGEVPDCPR